MARRQATPLDEINCRETEMILDDNGIRPVSIINFHSIIRGLAWHKKTGSDNGIVNRFGRYFNSDFYI